MLRCHSLIGATALSKNQILVFSYSNIKSARSKGKKKKKKEKKDKDKNKATRIF